MQKFGFAVELELPDLREITERIGDTSQTIWRRKSGRRR
jgi:hypothetical protein